MDDVQLNLVFSALSDPTRRAMLARLAKGDATVNELADPFGMAQPTISKHLQVLEKAGLIRTTRDAQRRPRRLVVGGPLAVVDTWLVPFRALWEARFDRLEASLEADATAPAAKRSSKTTRARKKKDTK
jgi:DNA-binding transcriptional ArsR family regulator